MPNLKDLRVRINSVKSTQKITAAMKMVAASKLRRAQEQAEAARPYAGRMERMLSSLAASQKENENAPKLLAGTGADRVQLLVVATSDRGLCGGFNTSVVRGAKGLIARLVNEDKTVKLLCLGRKGNDQLKRDYSGMIIDTIEDIGKPRLDFSDGEAIANRLAAMLQDGEFDVCTIVYNQFESVMSQKMTIQQLIPFPLPDDEGPGDAAMEAGPQAIYEFEPDETEILEDLLPRNLAVQVYRALLESFASEQGARMAAMDSATRNAGDMIDRLTLNYNRTRQAYITREMIEIVSGAEALT